MCFQNNEIFSNFSIGVSVFTISRDMSQLWFTTFMYMNHHNQWNIRINSIIFVVGLRSCRLRSSFCIPICSKFYPNTPFSRTGEIAGYHQHSDDALQQSSSLTSDFSCILDDIPRCFILMHTKSTVWAINPSCLVFAVVNFIVPSDQAHQDFSVLSPELQ